MSVQLIKQYDLEQNPARKDGTSFTFDKVMYQDHGRHDFLHTLHWDLEERKGHVIVARKQADGLRSHATCDLEDIENIQDDPNVDTYITLNVFNGRRRLGEQLRYLTSMFIDIDIHDAAEGELERKKREAQKMLLDKINIGSLPVPTMITDTGRGYGLFYVLDRTIAKTDATENVRGFFHGVYDGLVSRFRKELPGLIDTSVSDAARVCRLPGTTNTNTGTFCNLVYCDPEQKWNLKNLSGYIDRKEVQKKKVIDINKKRYEAAEQYGAGFCVYRIKSLRKLLALRGGNLYKKRELFLFIMYSTLIRVYSHEEAVNRLYLINQEFSEPLTEKELGEIEHIIKGTDKNIGESGHSGYYKFKDRTIIRILEITEEESKQIGLGCSKRNAEREEKRFRKEERTAEILKDLQAGVKYAEIASAYGVSEITVKRMAKQHGIQRYRKSDAGEESIILATRSGVVCCGSSLPVGWEVLYRSLGWYGERVADLLAEFDTISQRWDDRLLLEQRLSEYLDSPEHVAAYRDDQWMESGVLHEDKLWIENFLNEVKKAHQKSRVQRSSSVDDDFQPDFRFSGITKKKYPDIDQGMVRALHLFFSKQKQMKHFYGYSAEYVHSCFDAMTRDDILYLLLDLTRKKIRYPFAYTIAWVVEQHNRKVRGALGEEIRLEIDSEALFVMFNQQSGEQ